MALIDFLFNKGANKLYNDMQAVENYADMQKADALKSKLKPVLVPLQMDATGGLDAEATNRVQNYINNPVTEPNLWQKIVGRDVTTDTQTINPETNEITLGSSRVHEPGYLEKAGQGLKLGLNDILGGYGENRTQRFSTDNWNNNYLDNGNKKGLAYKLGEGLGSFAKLAESPLGRSLLVGGIVGASGGSGLETLSYGAQTGMLNQANRMKDQMYRAELKKMGFDTSGIRGYIGDDTFNKIFQSMQLQDNAKYRSQLLESNLRNQQEMMEYRKQEADRKARQDAIDTDIAYRNLGLKEKELEKKGQEDSKDMQTLNEMEAQLDDFVSTFDLVDNPYRYRIAGGASRLLNTLTPEESNFNAKRTLLFNAIARKLGEEKGVLSDQDIKRIDDALPKLADNKKQKMAKMEATYSLLNIRRGSRAQQTQGDGNTNSTPSLNVDRNSLEAEMKRRGLK